MEPSETRTLIDLCRPGYGSFSETVETTLDSLDGVVPGALLLGRVDQSQDSCRVVGSRQTALEALREGAVLPLAPGSAGAASGDGAPGVEIDPDFLGSLGMRAFATLPLELSNGRLVGVLAALDAGAGEQRPDHVALLAVGARLLSREWESVERRAEIRRLRSRLAESPGADAETGLLNREAYVDLLDHDWSLASRGTVESTLVALSVADPERHGAPFDRLAVKVAAEVLEGSIRRTDRAARIGERTLAATLIGCRGEQAPFFVDRFRGALERVTGSGALTVQFAHAIFPLADATAPEQALELAEAAVAASSPGSADQVEVAG
jgi:GGDEF domain-containing protein